jgi:hypothetical protein
MFRAVRPPARTSDLGGTERRDTVQRLKRTARSQIVVAVLLAAFVMLLALDISLPDVNTIGLECVLKTASAVLRCNYITSGPSSNVFSRELHYSRPIFGKALDVTVCFGLASLLYAMRHASLGSTPFLTYTCKEDCLETGKQWVAKVRNDGLGPAIRPVSTFRIMAPLRLEDPALHREWLDADATREILAQIFTETKIEFHPLGRGGAIAKDKEFTIFACDNAYIDAMDEFCMRLRFEGQYGSTFEKTIILVPPRSERRDARTGGGGAAPAAPHT